MIYVTYPCCQHCRDFGRRIGWLGPVDDDHENHQARCYTDGCPGGKAIQGGTET